MKKINDLEEKNSPILQSIRHCKLIELADHLYAIENNIKKFIQDLVYVDAIIDKSDIIHKIEASNSYEDIVVDDFISYHYAKGNNPIKELIKVYRLLTKALIPSTGSISGNLDHILIEQIPGCPIAQIDLPDKQKVSVTTKNNVIKVSISPISGR